MSESLSNPWLTGGTTLAVIVVAALLFASDPKVMSDRDIELYVSASPAQWQDTLDRAFAVRRGTPITNYQADMLRQAICLPTLGYRYRY